METQSIQDFTANSFLMLLLFPQNGYARKTLFLPAEIRIGNFKVSQV